MTNNENRELTAAELDLVAGGYDFKDCLISSYFMAPANGQTASAGTSNTTVSAMHDITQSKTV